MTTIDEFTTEGYQNHNDCRLKHLDSLCLPIKGRTVLELGAGIGDHTKYLLSKCCKVTCVEARKENAVRLMHRFPSVRAFVRDLEQPNSLPMTPKLDRYQIVYAYGILYHLSDPKRQLRRWAGACSEMLLLETCVSRNTTGVEYVRDDASSPTGSYRGTGCRPSRHWLEEQLKKLFTCVYVPTNVPDHIEFPNDWGSLPPNGLVRAIYIGCHYQLPDSYGDVLQRV